ncbi:MAG TPA: hypothetical protein VNO30_16610 [Kofleriaceae bacterium]|nr:hypothetical protein [Kofleriaceae bacterium]
MAGASRGWIGASLLLAAALAAALWLWRVTRAPEPPPPLEPAAASPAPGAPAAALVPPRPRGPAPSMPAITALRAAPVTPREVQHLLDPCTELAEPLTPIPAGFEAHADQGITIAWSPGAPAVGPVDAPLRPLSLAHLVTGILEEAAQLTGTPRRAELTVIVYPSRDEFHTATKAPRWAMGLYDGVVRVPADPSGELGIALPTLRHEVMHAQLHAAVGCMPVWFNEGAAMYFAGTAPARDWLAMLRAPAPLELLLLELPALDERATPQVDRLYAQSLAMVLYQAERAGAPSLAPAVAALADGNRASQRDGLALWSRLHPRTDHAAVLDALARRIFGVPAAELGAMLDGPLCCHGLARATELSCRATAARPGRAQWLDETTSPRASCRARW